ncbi:MAG: DUF2339 domain-containing protein [Bacteroidetes bacterium]|nr:DUF2339 domain-containing protein [Bacteroidota bacterium]
MILLTTDNVFQVAILLSLIILFTIGIAWSSRKFNKPTVNLTNFCFAIAIFGLHWLRKLAVNSRTEYMLLFFIYGIFFYVLFYAVIVYTSSAKEKALSKWMQLTMALTNLLFYSGTTAFVIIKYYSYGYLWIFALALLILNLLGLLLSGKYFQSAWKLPHHIVTIVLAALILPLLLNQSAILLFMAGFSVLFLLYAKYSKNQTSIVISMFAMVIMTLDFFFHWIFKYVPSLLFSADLPENTLVVHGIISGVTVVLALTMNNWLLKHIEVTLSKKMFSKTMYIRLMRGLILVTLFLSSGWILTTLLCYISGSKEVMASAWFIAGSLFFILLILLQSNKPNSFYQPILFIALASTLFYPLLVYLPMMETLNNLMLTGILPVSQVLLHYLALGLGIFIVAVSLVRIYKLYPTKKLLRRGLQLFVIIFLIFIICTEYDNLSILLKTSQFKNLTINASPLTLKHLSHNTSLSPGKGILEYNRHLPYSIILLATSLVLIVWSLFKHQRFLRNISILLFSFSIVKVFLYDFSLLGDAARTALFFVIGLLLIGFSVVYPRMKKATSIPRKKREIVN